MNFDRETLDSLREAVRTRISEKRYIHTLGVEKMAIALGSVLLPERLDELSAAAILHDVAKELTFDEHLALLKGSDVPYTQDDILSRPALHSIAAVPLIMSEFSEFATPDILSAVANHTLGAPGMSVFDEIIFISDYAEEGRTYPVCIEVHDFLLNKLDNNRSYEENVDALHLASLKATVSTVDSLTRRNEIINPKTLDTKKYLESLNLG